MIKLTKTIDKIATILEGKGLVSLAFELDRVSNSLDNSLFGVPLEGPPSEDIEIREAAALFRTQLKDVVYEGTNKKRDGSTREWKQALGTGYYFYSRNKELMVEVREKGATETRHLNIRTFDGTATNPEGEIKTIGNAPTNTKGGVPAKEALNMLASDLWKFFEKGIGRLDYMDPWSILQLGSSISDVLDVQVNLSSRYKRPLSPNEAKKVIFSQLKDFATKTPENEVFDQEKVQRLQDIVKSHEWFVKGSRKDYLQGKARSQGYSLGYRGKELDQYVEENTPEGLWSDDERDEERRNRRW